MITEKAVMPRPTGRNIPRRRPRLEPLDVTTGLEHVEFVAPINPEEPVDPEFNPVFTPVGEEPAEVFETVMEPGTVAMEPLEIDRNTGVGNVEMRIDGLEVPVMAGDEMYQRQASLGLNHPTVMLVGCGGVGVWAALALVLGGVENISLWDGDTLSTHNLNRFPLPPGMVGEMKSEALGKWLRELRPGDRDSISARGEFNPQIHGDSQAAVKNWLVCATDSLKSRRMCYNYAMERSMRYLEVGADGERWTLSPAPPEFSTEDEENPGYTTVPVHVGPCMMAGSAVAYYVLHNTSVRHSQVGTWQKGPIGNRVTERMGYLDFDTVEEEEGYSDKGRVCPFCGRDITDDIDLIYLIRHIRECKGWGLVEAKNAAEELFKKWKEEEKAEIEAAVAATRPSLSIDSITQASPTATELRSINDLYDELVDRGLPVERDETEDEGADR